MILFVFVTCNLCYSFLEDPVGVLDSFTLVIGFVAVCSSETFCIISLDSITVGNF